MVDEPVSTDDDALWAAYSSVMGEAARVRDEELLAAALRGVGTAPAVYRVVTAGGARELSEAAPLAEVVAALDAVYAAERNSAE